MGCDSAFGNRLARQLDTQGLRVLAMCLMEKELKQLRGQNSDRLEMVTLDITKTENIIAATQGVKECMGDRVWCRDWMARAVGESVLQTSCFVLNVFG
ncbi:hypothetical protein P7K49_019656 [Saguinus oedipus]|uniref:Uncharacterized protein n=1 Tax=Saguinus oedipus TaxID=9490 RepID=A0ABQ9UY00_SAGOE|nr:hypothetical protein P7K49_019656 [Saguinus oedipus]